MLVGPLGPFVYTIGTMRDLLMQRVMASLPGRVPVIWVLPMVLLAALGTSTIPAFADFHAFRPFWQQQNGAFAQCRLMAFQLQDECGVARAMAACHRPALAISTTTLYASSINMQFFSVLSCQLLAFLHRILACWHFGHVSRSAWIGGCLVAWLARRSMSGAVLGVWDRSVVSLLKSKVMDPIDNNICPTSFRP